MFSRRGGGGRPARFANKEFNKIKILLNIGEGKTREDTEKTALCFIIVFRISGRSKARPLSFLFFYLFFFLHGCRAYLYILSESFRKSNPQSPQTALRFAGLIPYPQCANIFLQLSR